MPAVFSAFLNINDAKRVSEVVEKLLENDLRECALAGGLAVEARLRDCGRPTDYGRTLNDVDLVVGDFNAIPTALAAGFVVNHVHPYAPEGKTLLQVIDRERTLRVDLFRAFGATLSRACVMDDQTGPLRVLAVEDLVARTTAYVCGRLRNGLEIDPKHVRAFTRLADLGRPEQLSDAWQDHRQDVPGSLEEATQEAHELLRRHPELVVSDQYSTTIAACERCQDYGPFRAASPRTIVEILGYW